MAFNTDSQTQFSVYIMNYLGKLIDRKETWALLAKILIL